MPQDSTTREDARLAARYFGSFVRDYHEAFRGAGRGLLQGTINRLFRRKTFQRRTEIVRGLLARHGIAGKQVLDLGCGTGEVSIVAAQLGAHVRGVDIVEQMVQVAREEAARAGLGDRIDFSVRDITASVGEAADVTLLVGVIEYYQHLEAILTPAASSTRELVIVADTRGPWWRRGLRRVLASAKQFHLYYRDPAQVAAVMAQLGFAEVERIAGHSFTVMAYRVERLPGR